MRSRNFPFGVKNRAGLRGAQRNALSPQPEAEGPQTGASVAADRLLHASPPCRRCGDPRDRQERPLWPNPVPSAAKLSVGLRGLSPGASHSPPGGLGRPQDRGDPRPAAHQRPRPRPRQPLSPARRSGEPSSPELCSRNLPALSSSLPGRQEASRGHRPARPNILRARGRASMEPRNSSEHSLFPARPRAAAANF